MLVNRNLNDTEAFPLLFTEQNQKGNKVTLGVMLKCAMTGSLREDSLRNFLSADFS